MAFSHGFVYTPSTPPPPSPLSATLIFQLMAGAGVVYILAKFLLHATCNSGVVIV